MGKLGDFLEVLHGPVNRFQTVEATITHWQDADLATEAICAGMSAHGRRKSDAGTPSVGVIETELRLWMNGPDRVRLETTRRGKNGTKTRLTVVGGKRWWERDDQGHVEAGERESARPRRPYLTDIERHFFPAALRECLSPLALEVAGEARTAGRECVRLRAVPRPDQLLWAHWLPSSADEYELHADPERGALLFVAGRWLGRVLETYTVDRVVYDEPLGDELFAYEPRPGEQVRPPDPIVQWLSLAAAVARVPFTVLIPACIPDKSDWQRTVTYTPARVGEDYAPFLTLMYHGPKHLSIKQYVSPPSQDDYEWDAVERGGQSMEISDPGGDDGTRLIRLEHLGTHVKITTDLPRDAALDLAASLEPFGKPEPTE
jgi:hypothetical protein